MTSKNEKWTWKDLNKKYAEQTRATRLRREFEKNYKPANCLEKQLAKYKKHTK